METIDLPGLFGATLLLVAVASLCGKATRRPPVRPWDGPPPGGRGLTGRLTGRGPTAGVGCPPTGAYTRRIWAPQIPSSQYVTISPGDLRGHARGGPSHERERGITL
jgi:hypothetical protein